MKHSSLRKQFSAAAAESAQGRVERRGAGEEVKGTDAKGPGEEFDVILNVVGCH